MFELYVPLHKPNTLYIKSSHSNFISIKSQNLYENGHEKALWHTHTRAQINVSATIAKFQWKWLVNNDCYPIHNFFCANKTGKNKKKHICLKRMLWFFCCRAIIIMIGTHIIYIVCTCGRVIRYCYGGHHKAILQFN